jgi:hypothetical protein
MKLSNRGRKKTVKKKANRTSFTVIVTETMYETFKNECVKPHESIAGALRRLVSNEIKRVRRQEKDV